MCLFCLTLGAQKFALVDMEYILNRIPAYERANEQLNQLSKRWQAEVEAVSLEAQTLYKNYQNEALFLSDEQKTKKEEEIVAKEKQASELKRQYFGPEGELYKKRESLMAPIQDEIYEAVKQICETDGYQVVIDRASASSMVYASPKIDISNEVLQKLGYSN
ncbi:MAG TPA: OmpH family outer membrane protein [Bacillota bacterium]|nr:OmpH family outer membrane protein [Bacillota bacterium]